MSFDGHGERWIAFWLMSYEAFDVKQRQESNQLDYEIFRRASFGWRSESPLRPRAARSGCAQSALRRREQHCSEASTVLPDAMLHICQRARPGCRRHLFDMDLDRIDNPG